VRFLWIPLAWLLITASLVGPQAAIAFLGSKILAVVVFAVTLGLLGLVLVRFAPSRNSAFVGLGIIVAISGLTAAIGTKSFQLAIGLSRGDALDGVTMAEALQRGREGTWVRLTDARVRSEAAHTLRFVSGARDDPSAQTRTAVAVAPVSLATEVTHEWPELRAKISGARVLWACSESVGTITQWDKERQAVRGRLGRMEQHVFDALNGELQPNDKASPGAGAIPAAPGASPAALRPSATLSASSGAWCIELDPSLDANAAKEHNRAPALAFLSMIPLFGLGVLAVALSKGQREATR
jgi:hypothetical protein